MSTAIKMSELEMVYTFSYWDFPREGLAKYEGERVWFSYREDEPIVSYNLKYLDTSKVPEGILNVPEDLLNRTFEEWVKDHRVRRGDIYYEHDLDRHAPMLEIGYPGHYRLYTLTVQELLTIQARRWTFNVCAGAHMEHHPDLHKAYQASEIKSNDAEGYPKHTIRDEARIPGEFFYKDFKYYCRPRH